MTDKEIELQHIWQEVQHQRWFMIERFLFSYTCFRDGYQTSKGKPDWQIAREKAAHSIAAASAKPQHRTLEPLVPFSVVIGEIKRVYRDEELSYSRLERLLDCLLSFATITHTEKDQLTALGIENSMPKSWYQSDKDSIQLRFNQANIQLTS